MPSEDEIDCSSSDHSGAGHLVVFVHGMDGNLYDLRTLRLVLVRLLPSLRFVMSSANQHDTHAAIEIQAARLIEEVNAAIADSKPTRVSIVAHSMGAIVVRAALEVAEFTQKFNSGR